MYILYVDGSGQPKINRNSQKNGLYVLTGVLVHEKDWRSIEKRLDDVKQELLSQIPPDKRELHAHPIWNNQKVFASKDRMLNFAKKEEIFSKVVDVVCESEITIVNVIIFKDRIKPRRSLTVVNNSWMHLLGRFETFLRQKPMHINNGLLYIDSCSKSSEFEIKETVRKWARLGDNRQDTQHVIEDPIFVESHRRNLIQLADMIAYVVHKHYKKDPEFERWFKLLEAKMYHFDGKLYDFGIKEIPNQQSV